MCSKSWRISGIHMTLRMLDLSLDSEIQLEGSFFSRGMNISQYVSVSSGMDNIRSNL